ncbi:hypothetical protein CIHG_04066 [Coccidioides immitis H538.4]|uniref:Uncharacterized protein n=3 Tax=Coccidioides immitis TaxID=5501 RepID=A0A0J8QJG7_COCIT|nr:hypothetical protein CIRG_04464 [Coccidioides immitis RMSCC 2394]KMU72559.1 hypothetical protein CISG_09676 [Coccidioides immitis RMSCC 3703]KMU86278.1 hypothetical protein CIHG_04066 [Coccidioides immitis H538.4]
MGQFLHETKDNNEPHFNALWKGAVPAYLLQLGAEKLLTGVTSSTLCRRGGFAQQQSARRLAAGTGRLRWNNKKDRELKMVLLYCAYISITQMLQPSLRHFPA